MTATIIEIALVTLLLIGIIKEEKLIELEKRAVNKLLDALAFCIAKVIIFRRRQTERLAPMPGIRVFVAPHHGKTNLVCRDFEM